MGAEKWNFSLRIFLPVPPSSFVPANVEFVCQGHDRGALSVAFSPDGTRLASTSSDSMIKLWDASTGTELFTLQGNQGEATCVAFSPDGKTLVSGYRFHTIKLWDANAGTELRMLTGHRGQVTSVAFSPDGTRLATASESSCSAK